MKVKLTISDRFAILSILPREGNFATLKIVREVRERLSLTEEEIKGYNVKQVNGQITWEKAQKTEEIEFGEFTTEMIKKTLMELDKNAKLEEQHYNIYEKFVEGNK